VYASLFAVIGTTYGAGDGTTFNLPNLQGRVPIGRDTAQTEFDVRGETGGSKSLTIGEANLPAHTHSIDHNHAEVTSSSDSHNHDFTTDNDTHNHDVSDTGFTGASVFVASGSISVADNLSGTRTTDNDTHNHSGTTDTDTHSHTVNLPNFEGTSGSTGSGTALPSLPPYLVLNYIIKS
jgi:microcystin-dependent protein